MIYINNDFDSPKRYNVFVDKNSTLMDNWAIAQLSYFKKKIKSNLIVTEFFIIKIQYDIHM